MITVESALFGSLVTVGVFIIAGVVRLSNTMVQIQTTIEFIKDDLKSLSLAVITFDTKYISKEEAVKEFTKASATDSGLWKRNDEQRDRLEKIERKCLINHPNHQKGE